MTFLPIFDSIVPSVGEHSYKSIVWEEQGGLENQERQVSGHHCDDIQRGHRGTEVAFALPAQPAQVQFPDFPILFLRT